MPFAKWPRKSGHKSHFQLCVYLFRLPSFHGLNFRNIFKPTDRKVGSCQNNTARHPDRLIQPPINQSAPLVPLSRNKCPQLPPPIIRPLIETVKKRPAPLCYKFPFGKLVRAQLRAYFTGRIDSLRNDKYPRKS